MRQAITRRNDDSINWHIYASSGFSVLDRVECSYLTHIHLFIAMIYMFVKIIYDIVPLLYLFVTYLEHIINPVVAVVIAMKDPFL